MGHAINLTGKKFGRLTVLSRAENDPVAGLVRWLCRCDCGNEIVVKSQPLRAGQQSCGCLKSELRTTNNQSRAKKYHGKTISEWAALQNETVNAVYNRIAKHGTPRLLENRSHGRPVKITKAFRADIGRLAARLGARELAKKLNISYMSLRRIIRGANDPRSSVVDSIRALLDAE